MQNSQILGELNQVLEDMDYFNVFAATQDGLARGLERAATDTDRIRMILRNPDVQEYLFPDWRRLKDTIADPVSYYIKLRQKGVIPPR